MPQHNRPPQHQKRASNSSKQQRSAAGSASVSSISSSSNSNNSSSSLASSLDNVDTQSPVATRHRIKQESALRQYWHHKRSSNTNSASATAAAVKEAIDALTMEQAILDAIRIGCDAHVKKEVPGGWDGLQGVLRRIKEKFTERNYEGIFGGDSSSALSFETSDAKEKDSREQVERKVENQEEILPMQLVAYAAGYSAGRALCYWDLFTGVPVLRNILTNPTKNQDNRINVLAIGAGPAAEVIGIASAIAPITFTSSSSVDTVALAETNTAPSINLHVQDIAEYGPITHSIAKSSSDMFNLSSDRFNVSFSRGDILTSDLDKRGDIDKRIGTADCVTAFFVLNEVLGRSKKEFVGLVGRLVGGMKVGGVLVVVDSAGSFSEVKVGGGGKDGKSDGGANVGEEDEGDEEHEDLDPSRSAPTRAHSGASANSTSQAQARTYMVYHLLDGIKNFEIVARSDSRWYRVPYASQPLLSYPAKLHNMRHFVRVYRKKAT
ncbi:hypothetical protein HDU97_007815 [Phlyctochytrium planicorne]|nr:hypothetical protein HDU97_007815 [Phlyctochytrium planicorne]